MDPTVGVNGTTPLHVLTVFHDIFGAGAGQVPLGSTINTATFMLRIIDPSSDAMDLHRMLGDWSESMATWDNLLLKGKLLFYMANLGSSTISDTHLQQKAAASCPR